MTKTELVGMIMAKSGLTKVDAGKAIDAFQEVVVETLAKGDKVSLVGFGTFSVSERAARTGKNPQTGEAIDIAACKLPKFKAGKTLKEAVAG